MAKSASAGAAPKAKPVARSAASRVTLESVMSELKSFGTEQTRKTYRRHGAPEPLFGVLFSNLYALKKRLKVNHDLARQLWATGNTDARTLAAMIADPTKLTDQEAEQWLRGTSYQGLVDGVAGIVAQAPFARKKSDEWRRSKDEFIGRAGWNLIARLTEDRGIPDSYFEKRIAEIRAQIHSAKNRTREAMNLALISIGGYREGLRKKALEAAKAIGSVQVDHGDTACKTPDAYSYIQKMAARKSGRSSGARASASGSRSPS